MGPSSQLENDIMTDRCKNIRSALPSTSFAGGNERNCQSIHSFTSPREGWVESYQPTTYWYLWLSSMLLCLFARVTGLNAPKNTRPSNKSRSRNRVKNCCDHAPLLRGGSRIPNKRAHRRSRVPQHIILPNFPNRFWAKSNRLTILGLQLLLWFHSIGDKPKPS